MVWLGPSVTFGALKRVDGRRILLPGGTGAEFFQFTVVATVSERDTDPGRNHRSGGNGQTTVLISIDLTISSNLLSDP